MKNQSRKNHFYRSLLDMGATAFEATKYMELQELYPYEQLKHRWRYREKDNT